MSLALSTLIYEWRRYLAAVVSLAFAGLLVLSVTGIFAGIGKSFNAPIDHSPADLMVLGPNATALFGGSGAGLPRRIMAEIYLNPAVSEVSDLEVNFALWQNDPNAGGAGGKKTRQRTQGGGVQIYAVDNHEGSVTMPTDFGPDVRAALDEPYAIAVDDTALKPLGVRVGDRASLNSKSVTVRYAVHGYANVINQTVFMSRQTARLLGLASTGTNVGPLMIRLKPGSDPIKVRDELNAASHDKYRAWTRSDLSQANQDNLLKNNFIGILLIGGMVLGFLVGTIITWQVLRGAIFANIKEFASLRALGVSVGSLRWVIMELSFWVGVAGLFMTAFLVWALTAFAASFSLPMAYPTPMVTAVVILLLVIAVLSGFLSLGVLKKSQPADLLR